MRFQLDLLCRHAVLVKVFAMPGVRFYVPGNFHVVLFSLTIVL